LCAFSLLGAAALGQIAPLLRQRTTEDDWLVLAATAHCDGGRFGGTASPSPHSRTHCLSTPTGSAWRPSQKGLKNVPLTVFGVEVECGSIEVCKSIFPLICSFHFFAIAEKITATTKPIENRPSHSLSSRDRSRRQLVMNGIQLTGDAAICVVYSKEDR
jgi:hypothetical protein